MRSQPRAAEALTARERRTLLAALETAIPAGRSLPGAGPRTAAGVEAMLARGGANVVAGYRALLWSLDGNAMMRHGRSFASLDADARLALLDGWRLGDFARRTALRALLGPGRLIHFNDPALYHGGGCVYEPPAAESRPRWPAWMEERVLAARDLDGETLEADVVVVGTGAGGAVVGRELAEAGLAVILVEEGQYFQRADFQGGAFERQQKLYRDGGVSFTIGNAAIFLPTGMSVGGSTTVNSGTCYRAPERVFEEWRREFGLSDFTNEAMDPYYRRVESVLGVAEADARFLGGVARLIARGCDALGYSHHPLRRNAPDCDGQGMCCFGCPTDAKRSTNVSYVPLALRAGANVVTGLRVESILVEGGRVVGVEGRATGLPKGAGERDGAQPGSPRGVRVRARAVVVSGGALQTPLLLEQNGLGGRSGELGRNLSIHPACGAAALFDERVDGFHAIPQGYAIDEFKDEGLLFEGAFAPLDITAATCTLIGPEFTELMEAYDRMAVFGYMIEDVSRGRVRRGPGGRPVVTYVLEDHDVARLKRGMEILARVYFAAGARQVLPVVHGHEVMNDERDLERFRAARLAARDFDLSAYHPLGTARMGADPSRSVVGPSHEVHDAPGLYVVDGSSVPSSLGVNPQLTIMAMATRAAEKLAARLA